MVIGRVHEYGGSYGDDEVVPTDPNGDDPADGD